MKTPEQDRLLDDVLRNESYVAFRAELYRKSLVEFPPPRWVKSRNQLLAIAACVPVILGLYLLSTPRTATTTEAQPASRHDPFRRPPFKKIELSKTAGA